jgi:hypothetical protein
MVALRHQIAVLKRNRPSGHSIEPFNVIMGDRSSHGRQYREHSECELGSDVLHTHQ